MHTGDMWFALPAGTLPKLRVCIRSRLGNKVENGVFKCRSNEE